ncbi:MAG: hypothetical protein ACREUM_05315 [Nitrosospira sp.]
MSIDQIVDVLAMGHRFMTTVGSVYVPLRMTRALMSRRTIFRIGFCYANYMFIDVVPVRVVQMSIVQIIDMPIMHNTCVAALRAMRMSMIFVLWQGTIGHLRSPLKDNELMRGNVQLG